MNILVINHGEPWKALASTSLIKGLYSKYGNIDLDWSTSEENIGIYRYNNKINNLIIGFGACYSKYDIAINLDPSTGAGKVISEVEAKVKLGYGLESNKSVPLTNEAELFFQVLNGEKRTTKHYLQIIYKLSGTVWRGEGYNLSYYPRNKMKRKKTGIAVKNTGLRKFTKDNLRLNHSEIWHVPVRQDLLKRIDEINRVKQLITDDLFCLHAGISMKKHVEFLDVENINMTVEFFGKGYHHRINNEYW